jgi:uncharacterized membrane protein (UPF0127 family)
MAQLRNERTGAVLAEHVAAAATPWERLVGYLPRASVDANEGLWFDRCSTIHTVGMRASIDVIFVDRDWRVVRVVAPAPLNRLLSGGAQAVGTIELGSGALAPERVAVGDRLRLV